MKKEITQTSRTLQMLDDATAIKINLGRAQTLWLLVRKRTIPTDRLPLVGEF
jgi:hypothetical protein